MILKVILLFIFGGIMLTTCLPSISATSCKSYCYNSTFCGESQCDLGICCDTSFNFIASGSNGTCVQFPRQLRPGDYCGFNSSVNLCVSCPTGYICNSSFYCAPALQYNLPDCLASTGCYCNTSNTCDSGLCFMGVCAPSTLSPGDFGCFEDAQCLAGGCRLGTCSSPGAGQSCPNGICGYGSTCNVTDQLCYALPKLNQSCSVETPCGDYAADCVNGTCTDIFSVPEGGYCKIDRDCKENLKCVNNNCAIPFVAACNGGIQCNDACRCGEPSQKEYCPSQYSAFVKCMRINQCSSLILQEGNCGYVFCKSEYFSYVCCSSCGNNTIANNNTVDVPGLDCSGTLPAFTFPKNCGPNSQTPPTTCSFPKGRCSRSTNSSETATTSSSTHIIITTPATQSANNPNLQSYESNPDATIITSSNPNDPVIVLVKVGCKNEGTQQNIFEILIFFILVILVL